MKKIFFIMLVSLLTTNYGCKKTIEIPLPKTNLVGASVFSNNKTANQAQLSIFSQLGYSGYLYYLTLYPGWSADELDNYSTNPDDIGIYTNSLLPNNSHTYDIWSRSYSYIFQENELLEGIQASKTLDTKVVQQLKGEAEFTRAFLYFYLVNLFGDVPLVLSTEYAKSNQMPRTSKEQVYDQIITDLKDAENLLNAEYIGADGVTTSIERIRPTKWAASALLARVYLYRKDYANAYTEASLVISNTAKFEIVSDLNKVFKINSREAIWQTSEGLYNPTIGFLMILSAAPDNSALSKQLLNAFEPNDKRKQNWVGSINAGGTYYFPFKYQDNSFGNGVSEYDMILRLAEQYLIRAESQANGAGSGLSGAIADQNVVRNRAGIGPYTGATDKTSVLNAIMHERQVELFTELGHRWLDLKRTGNVDNVMTTVESQKAATWVTTQQLYPIPQADRNADQNLTQNPGY